MRFAPFATRCFVGILTLSLAAKADAQTTYVWNSATSDNWSTAGRWTPAGPANGIDAFADFSTVDLPAAPTTVTLDNSYTVGTLRFGDTNTSTAGSWVLADGGGTLTLATTGLSGPIIQVNALGTNATVSISAVLTGTQGFTKTGTGTLVLNGAQAHTYTGTTSLAAGVLRLDFANLVSTTDLINPLSSLNLAGGTLSLLGQATAGTTSSQTFAGTTVSGAISTVFLTQGAGAVATRVNFGAITRTQPGAVLVFNDTPSTALVATTTGVNGAPLPTGSTLRYIAPWILYGTGTNVRYARINSTGTIVTGTTSTGATNTTAGNITNPAEVYSFNTAGQPYTVTTALQAFGIYYNQAGTTTVSFQSGGSLTSGGFINLNAGGLILAQGIGGIGVIPAADNDLVVVIASSAGIRFSSPIVNSTAGNSNVTMMNSGGGTGAVTFDVTPKTYTGLTTVNSGTLTLALANVLHPDSGIVMNGGTLGITTFNQSVNSLKLLGGSVTGTTGLLGSTTNFDLQAGTISAILAGNVAAVKTTSGAVTLSGANAFTGGLAMNSGTLTLSGANTFSGGFAVNAGNATISGAAANTYTGGTTVAAGATLTLAKTGGANALGGNLTISGGSLLFSTSGTQDQIPNTATVTMSAGAFNGTGVNNGGFSVNETVGALSFTGGWFSTGTDSNWLVAGAFTATGGTGFTYLQNSGSSLSTNSLSLTNMTATAGGTINTPNSFSVYGASLLATSTLTVGSGGLTLANSVINLRMGSTAGQLGSRVILDGDVTTTGTLPSAIAFDTGGGSIGSVSVQLSSTVGTFTRTFNLAADLNVAVPVTNGAATSAGITKVGSGSLNLNAVNTYTDATTVSAGTLGGIGSLAGAVNVNPGGTIRGASGIGTGTLTLGGNLTVTGAPGWNAGGAIAIYLPTAKPASGDVTGNSKLATGATNVAFDSSAGPFVIRLLNDGGFTVGNSYSVTLMTSSGGTNYTGTSGNFDVISGTGQFNYTNASLSVDAGNNLVLGFTVAAVPEPATMLGFSAAALGLAGWLRRRRNGRECRQ